MRLGDHKAGLRDPAGSGGSPDEVTVRGKVGTSAGQLKPSKLDGTTSWAVCQRQFKVEADHNDWIPSEKAVQLLSVLKRQDTDVLVSLPKLRTRKSSGLLTATQGQIPDEQ